MLGWRGLTYSPPAWSLHVRVFPSELDQMVPLFKKGDCRVPVKEELDSSGSLVRSMQVLEKKVLRVEPQLQEEQYGSVLDHWSSSTPYNR